MISVLPNGTILRQNSLTINELNNIMKEQIVAQLKEGALVKMKTAELLADEIAKTAEWILDSYRKGGKILLIGNGGSAADAQHIAGELVGNLDPKRKRRALPALALTTNTSTLTAISNDYGYEEVFARKVEAFATHKEDILIAITTSGNSPNILRAVKVAKEKGIRVIGLTGKGGGELKKIADLSIVIPSQNTQRIQETHIAIGHIVCDLVEEAFVNGTLI